MKSKIINLKRNSIKISNSLPIVLIAGPCVIENEKSALGLASALKEITKEYKIPFVFKASYDKANRSSIKSFRGPGLREGLRILKKIKMQHSIPILTDVHCKTEVRDVSKIADVIQIPAFLCRQTDLIVASARTGLPINVKKGQFLAPEDMSNIIEKIEKQDNRKVLLTERGATFGYHNLVLDLRSIDIMKRNGYPVIYDATHSVQLPGGLGKSTGGQKEFIEVLAKGAVSCGIAGIFVEVHKNPSKALSDGPNSLSLKELPIFLENILAIDRTVKKLN